MNFFKRFFSEVIDFFVTKVVNYLAMMLVLIAVLCKFFPTQYGVFESSSIIMYIIMGFTGLSILSIVIFSIYDFILDLRLFVFVSTVGIQISSLLKSIKYSPKANKTIELAKKYSTDLNTIKYLEKISMVATFETLAFANVHFGYLLIPALQIFGLINFTFFSPSSFIMLMFGSLTKFCIVGFFLRYIMPFYLTMNLSIVSENYNKVIYFYQVIHSPKK